MGFFDGLFGSDKPTQKSIDKLLVRVKERYAQPEYRREAMDKLLSWSTPEAFAAALQRFTVVAQSPHWDEEEKKWLVNELAERGEPARQALKTFLANQNHIAFAAQALKKLANDDDYVLDLTAALKAHAPEDYRSTQGKTELVMCLTETRDRRVIEVVLPYLTDHGDDVQCAAVDALEKLGPKEGPGRDIVVHALQPIVVDDTRSARVLRHTANAMFRLQVPVDLARPLAPAVAEDFAVKEGKLAPSHEGR